MTFRRLEYSLALLAALLLLPACGSSRRVITGGGEGLHVGSYRVAKPVLRIGLEERISSIVTVKAPGGIVLVDHRRGVVVAPRRLHTQISFFVAAAGVGATTQIFSVQVASLTNERQAEALAGKIRDELGLPASVRYSSQTRTFRVRVGEAPDRTGASEVEKILREAGYRDTWVVRDSEGTGRGGSLAAVDSGGKRIAVAAVFRCAPRSPGGLLEVGGVRYRGALELRVGPGGLALPINLVNLDQYLRGVVPAEMGPVTYPQLDALKAQAVAARTYAFKNRGQFAREGYDLCDSARCQVYRGADIEHELTDRAVLETSGEIIAYDGEPINALFTSTCGGHTEDAENIFAGEEPPYLRGVLCEPEAELFSRIGADGEPEVIFGSDGLPLNYELAALALEGVLPDKFSAEPGEEISPGQWGQWVDAIARRLGGRGKADIADGQSDLTLWRAIEILVAACGWEERIAGQVSDGDLQILGGFGVAEDLDRESRRALLYFLRLGLIGPEPDGRLGFEEPLRQGKAVRLLHRLLEHEGAAGTVVGRLVRADNEELVIRLGGEAKRYGLVRGVRLFKRFGGYTLPVRTLQMAPGDHLILNLRRGRVGALVHTPSLEGIASDRSSRFFQWDVSYTARELAERIERYADVGRIDELRPLRYGVSERVVELEVVGGGGSVVLRGLQIRQALGLRENLFVIERKYDEFGNVRSWRFIGKGWGHGVGLCQVGASGMAIAGKSYREILRHYYTGVRIEKRY